MSDRDDLGLFAAYGIEIEYMVVAADGLDVQPCVDQVLGEVAGPGRHSFEAGRIDWSNELVNHVIELKCAQPEASLTGLADAFHAQVQAVNAALEPHAARLLPGGMHPWMQPQREMQLFPSGEHRIYSAFDRIFGCRHHGFANLQSTHINLPFQGDAEFGRLHAAVRAVLPLLPALAAASPYIEGRDSGDADHRLRVYRSNCARVPSITGAVIPEPVYTIGGYHDLLAGLYRDIAPLDPDGVLQEEWLNARGAIARFDRNCIEIRVVDAQECPRADLAIVELTVALLKALCAERWAPLARLQALETADLLRALEQGIVHGEQAGYDAVAWLRALGHPGREAGARQLLDGLVNALAEDLSADAQRVLEVILAQGTLASRLRRRLGPAPDRERQRAVYRELADALADNRSY